MEIIWNGSNQMELMALMGGLATIANKDPKDPKAVLLTVGNNQYRLPHLTHLLKLEDGTITCTVPNRDGPYITTAQNPSAKTKSVTWRPSKTAEELQAKRAADALERVKARAAR